MGASESAPDIVEILMAGREETISAKAASPLLTHIWGEYTNGPLVLQS